MKKTFRLLSLLLVCLLLFTACNQASNNGNDTSNGNTDDQTTEETTTATPKEVYGFWHSAEVQGALEVVKDSNRAVFYSLTVGYYEYFASEEATYTLDGSILTLFLNDEEYEFVFDAKKDTLTLNDYVYSREEEAPIAHPIYEFPKYAEMNFDNVFRLVDYKNMNIYQTAIEEAQFEIFFNYYETALEDFREVTDRPVKSGDYVNIDYTGYLNGVKFSGGTASDQFVKITKNSGYIPGFAEGLIGHSKGSETFDVPVTFPQNYGSAELAGKSVIFKMKINAVYDVTLTEEQFATYENLEYGTYEEWVVGLAKEKAPATVKSILISDTELLKDLPKEAYAYFHQYYLDNFHYMAFYYGLDYETYLSYIGYNEESILSLAKNIATGYILPFLIAKAENLTWTQEQYDAQFDLLVQELMDSNEEYTKEQATEIINEKQLDYLTAELMNQIVIDWLVEQNFHP